MRRRLISAVLGSALVASGAAAAIAKSSDAGSFLRRYIAIKHYWSLPHDFDCWEDHRSEYREYLAARGIELVGPYKSRYWFFSCAMWRHPSRQPRAPLDDWRQAVNEWIEATYGWDCQWWPKSVPRQSRDAPTRFLCFPLIRSPIALKHHGTSFVKTLLRPENETNPQSR